MANKTLWYQSTSITGVNNGDALSSWPEDIGHYTATGSSTTRPIYYTNIQNGLPGVFWDGVDDTMSFSGHPNLPATSGWSCFIVVRGLSGQTNFGSFIHDSSDNRGLFWHNHSDRKMKWYSGPPLFEEMANATGLSPGVTHIYNVIVDPSGSGGDYHHRLDRLADGDSASAGVGWTPNLLGGALFGGVTSYMYLFELSLWDAPMTLAERITEENRLYKKWFVPRVWHGAPSHRRTPSA